MSVGREEIAWNRKYVFWRAMISHGVSVLDCAWNSNNVDLSVP